MNLAVRSIILLALISLVGCAQTLRSRVNSFTASEPIARNATIAVVPSISGLEQSLEFGLYKSQLERALVKQGFTLVESTRAELHAVLSYSVSRLAETSDGGVRTGVMLGSQRGAFGSNVMILDPARKAGWYERKGGVVIERNTGARLRLYEVQAQSVGTCGVKIHGFPIHPRATETA